MEQATDVRDCSWGRCTWQVRFMMAASARGSSKVTGYRETEDRDGLCVSICAAIGSPISTVFSRIKVIRPMNNNTSWYRLADVN